MAKIRVVNTRFWIDDYISNLDPIEKLLFLYFLTNPMTDICGIYELPLKNIALDTGIDKEMVIKILARFERDQKIFYKNGWVAIKNFAKHQSINPSVKKGIEIGLIKAPKEIIDLISGQAVTGSDSLSHLNLNINLNSNLNTNTGETSSPEIVKIINSFKEINPSYKKLFANKTQRTAAKNLVATHNLDKVLETVSYLKNTNSLKFFPVITTPVQLEDKWAQLMAAGHKYKNNQPIIL